MKQKWFSYTKHLLLLFLILQLFSIPSYASASDSPTVQVQLHKLIEDLAKDPNSKGIQAGLVVYNLSKKNPLFHYQEKKAFVPASTLKLLVSTAILEELSPSYQFKTEMYIDGTVSSSGVLNGDLILKGYGDPSLTVEDLNVMVQQLKKEHGIKRINGDILADESYFDDVRLGPSWMWDDEPWYYSAQISALGVNRNSVDITVSSNHKAIGQAPDVQMMPDNTYVKIDNTAAIQAGTVEDIEMDRPRLQNTISIKGSLGQNAKPAEESLSVEDPALFAAHLLKEQLSQNGMTFSPQTKVTKSGSLQLLPAITHSSKPLGELVQHLNKESDNFYSEMFLKTLGAEKKGIGSFSAGLEAVSEVLQKAELNPPYHHVDGSGLSRLNFITPEQMLELLLYIKKQPYASILDKSLPIAGVDGTLKSRMVGTLAEKNLHAKTGSMSGVNNMAGFVQAANGDQLAFSLFLNGIYKSKYARDFQDRVGTALAAYSGNGQSGVQEFIEEEFPLSKELGPILNEEALQSSTVGVMIQSVKDGKILYANNENKLLTPASTIKIWPTMSALSKLDKETPFHTELYITGTQPPGAVLEGDLILKGHGDPTLNTEDIDQLAAAIKDLHIKQIHGNLIVDDQEFDHQLYPLGWTWDHESDGHYAQISALGVNEGSVTVHLEPGRHVGEKVKLSVLPQTDYVQIINEATTTDSTASSLKIERERGTNRIHITGKLPIHSEKESRSISVEDPALYAGTLLKEKLNAAGILFKPDSQVMRGSLPASAKKIKELTSQPLKDILLDMNSKDDHYYAEMITKKLGTLSDDKTGTTSAGLDVIYDQLEGLQVDTTFDLYDGSGVTRYNQISVKHLNETLIALSANESFVNSIVTVPWESEPQAHLKAISSSVPGIYSWTGYVTNPAGDRFAVSLIINGVAKNEEVWKETGKKLIEELMK